MNCVFETTPTADGRFNQKCLGGCFVTRSTKYVRTCDCDKSVKPGECIHLGGMLGFAECPSCNNKTTKLKVFHCALKGKCTWQGKVPEADGVCHGCPDAEKPSDASARS